MTAISIRGIKGGVQTGVQGCVMQGLTSMEGVCLFQLQWEVIEGVEADSDLA